MVVKCAMIIGLLLVLLSFISQTLIFPQNYCCWAEKLCNCRTPFLTVDRTASIKTTEGLHLKTQIVQTKIIIIILPHF